MNEETLERLVMDREFGALSADVAALLDAYLAENPARARQAQESEEISEAAE